MRTLKTAVILSRASAELQEKVCAQSRKARGEDGVRSQTRAWTSCTGCTGGVIALRVFPGQLWMLWLW